MPMPGFTNPDPNAPPDPYNPPPAQSIFGVGADDPVRASGQSGFQWGHQSTAPPTPPNPQANAWMSAANQARLASQPALYRMSQYAQGQGPSVAAARQQAGIQAAQEQALAAVGATRGGWGGAMARNAAGGLGATGAQGAINKFAPERLQEQQEAQGHYMRAAMEQMAQDLKAAGIDEQTAYQMAAIKLGQYSQQSQQMQNNYAFQLGLTGAGAGGVSGAAQWAAQGSNGGAPSETSDFGWGGASLGVDTGQAGSSVTGGGSSAGWGV